MEHKRPVSFIGVFTRTEAVTAIKVSGKYTENTQLRQMLMLGKIIYFYGQIGMDFPTTKGNISNILLQSV